MSLDRPAWRSRPSVTAIGSHTRAHGDTTVSRKTRFMTTCTPRRCTFVARRPVAGRLQGEERRKEALFQVIVKNGIVISTKIEAFSQNEAPKRLRLWTAPVCWTGRREGETRALCGARGRGVRGVESNAFAEKRNERT